MSHPYNQLATLVRNRGQIGRFPVSNHPGETRAFVICANLEILQPKINRSVTRDRAKAGSATINFCDADERCRVIVYENCFMSRRIFSKGGE